MIISNAAATTPTDSLDKRLSAVSAAPSSGQTQSSATAWWRSATTSSTESPRPSAKAGSARSKAFASASLGPNPRSTRSTPPPQPIAQLTLACQPSHKSRGEAPGDYPPSIRPSRRVRTLHTPVRRADRDLADGSRQGSWAGSFGHSLVTIQQGLAAQRVRLSIWRGSTSRTLGGGDDHAPIVSFSCRGRDTSRGLPGLHPRLPWLPG